MSKSNGFYTPSQQNVIDFRGKNMLVSASAGTGKTTVMIERIVSLIEEGADVSQFVVVTFTNLAAAEMKSRLAKKLAEKRNNPRIVEQLEKLDSASICTLHSFCVELLRNYFYVVDIDPSFAILDSVTVSTLRKNTLDDLFNEYFHQKDDIFRQVYKIFATHRREDNFKETLLKIYDFSRCLENFGEWYQQKRNNFVEYSEQNPLIATILQDIKQSVAYYKNNLQSLAERCQEEQLSIVSVCQGNVELLDQVRFDNLQNAIFDLCKTKFVSMPRKSGKIEYSSIELNIRDNFADLRDDFNDFRKKYENLCRGEHIDTLWAETQNSLIYTDKLVEIVEKFDKAFFEAKKQRGGVDFNDLEHLTLKLLRDDETLAQIKNRYKFVFVDEYQDTNPVQEAIVSALAGDNNLFMVGDVKQSIYGFRGCEPSIFVDKYNSYKSTNCGKVEELNDNFRSNHQILEFVNQVFNGIMTADFGKVAYSETSQLRGSSPALLKTPSVRVDFVLSTESDKREIDTIYDITAEEESCDGLKQGELIANRIKQYVGMAYRDKNGNSKRIGYGDIVILMRSLTDRAIDIYNTLVAHNIPVAASFKVDGFSSKEVRDLVTLMRVIDNPYNDVYLVGACLSPLGGFTETELGHIRLDTDGRVPFYERIQSYAEKGQNAKIINKIKGLLAFLHQIRFYSRSASVSELVLRIMQLKDYHLYVQGLPNGGLRLRKLYAFIDSVKGASYAQSVDKFLSYVDETDDNRAEDGLSQSNTVRLMTMHASKGLEFPIVFVAGLDTPFRFDHETVEKNAHMGLAIRHYNFENMRVADTIGATACGMFNKLKQREEEMRLLYVAITRAKYVLNLVSVVTDKQLKGLPKLPTRATSHLDWLLLAIRNKYQSQLGIVNDGVEVNVLDNMEKLTSVSGSNGYMCEQIEDADAINKQIYYKYRYVSETNMPSKVVSSMLDKEYIDTTDEPIVEHAINVDNDRNLIGTAYHKVYQYVSYTANIDEIAQTIKELVNEGKIEARFADKLDTTLIYNTLNNPELVQLLSKGKVYHEIPFMLYVPYNQVAKDNRFSDEVMLQGVVDLLVLSNDSAIVVDFKYTSRSDLVEERYTMQLNSYKLAVERICGVQNVQCYVLSVADNKLIKM